MARLRQGIPLHILLVSICLIAFLARFWSSFVAYSQLRMPAKLMYIVTHFPEEVRGGFLDHYNSSILNVFYLMYFGLQPLVGDFWSNALIFIGISALLIFSVYFVLFTLLKSPFAAALATAIVLLTDLPTQPSVGANGHPGIGALNAYLGLGVILSAYGALLLRRYYLYSALMIVSFFCHQPLSMMASAALLPLVWQLTAQKRSAFLAHVASYGCTVGMMIIIQHLTGTASLLANKSDLWFHVVALFNSGHLFPDYGTGLWWNFYCFISFLVAGFVTCLACSEIRKNLLYALVVGGTIFFGSLPFIYLYRLEMIFLLMPIRVSTFLTLLILIFLLADLFRRLLYSATLITIEMVLVAVSLGTATLGTCAAAFVLSFLTCVRIAIASTGHRQILALLGACLTLIMPFLSQMPKALLFPSPSRLLACALVIAICLVVSWLRIRGGWNRFNRASVALAALVIVCVVTLGYGPAFNASQKLLDETRDFTALGDWVNENAPAGKPVLVPPEIRMPIFEAVSRRGSLLQLRKVAWIYGSPNLQNDFQGFLNHLDIDLARIKTRSELLRAAPEKWRSVSPDRFKELGAAYNATLLVTYVDHQLPFDVAYQGSFYKIYNVQASRGDGGPTAGAPKDVWEDSSLGSEDKSKTSRANTTAVRTEFRPPNPVERTSDW